MNQVFRVALPALAAVVALAGPTLALGPGDPAPAFEAESTAGKVALADYRGRKNVLLAFYYKDFTGG